MRDLVRLWLSHMSTLTILPLKIATAGCFLLALFGFGLGSIEIARALRLGTAPPGWLSLFCATTFLFAMLFAFLGILSVYVGRTYIAANSRGLRWIRSTSAAGRIKPGENGPRDERAG
jgi:undecaprenyl-phosphate 4-deoxy-4-formamido-L-arabinose transferase